MSGFKSTNFTANGIDNYTTVTGSLPFTVTFISTFNSVPPSDPTSWLWDFGDGGTSTLQNPVYVYNTAGVYDITFTPDNGFPSILVTAYISVANGIGASYSVSSFTPTAGDTVVLNGSASSAYPGRSVVSYQWIITTGSEFATLVGDTSSSSINLVTTAAGTVIVELTTTDNTGSVSKQSQTMEISGHAAPGRVILQSIKMNGRIML